VVKKGRLRCGWRACGDGCTSDVGGADEREQNAAIKRIRLVAGEKRAGNEPKGF